MRVGIDARKIRDGGIGVYLRETVAAMLRLEPALEVVAFGDPADRELLPGAEWTPVSAGKYSIAEHAVVPAAVARARVDLFHAPHYVVPLAIPGRVVVTIHDLIHVLFPRTWIHPLYARTLVRWALWRASRIVTVSETTGRDLERLFGTDRGRIRVIPNGVASGFRPLSEDEIAPQLARLGVGRPYVLFVGNCLPHKNVALLVRAWARLPEPRPDLVLCGTGFERDRGVMEALGGAGPGVKILGPVGPGDLVALYGGAELVALVSLYEGFGLPALEAMACGTPLLAARAGALPEVAGEAALWVSPDDVDLIAAGMYRLLNEPELRKGLIRVGFERVREFSWDAAARRTLTVYAEARGF